MTKKKTEQERKWARNARNNDKFIKEQTYLVNELTQQFIDDPRVHAFCHKHALGNVNAKENSPAQDLYWASYTNLLQKVAGLIATGVF